MGDLFDAAAMYDEEALALALQIGAPALIATGLLAVGASVARTGPARPGQRHRPRRVGYDRVSRRRPDHHA
jgi:hypothetical protein